MTRRNRRDRAAWALAASGAGALLRRIGVWRGDLVLGYHRVGDGSGSPYDRGLWSATPEAFDAQLAFLSRHFPVVGPDALLEARPAAPRRVVITFDDGYRDNYEAALPALRRHGLTATFFLATGFIDLPAVPWWDEIAWMVRSSPERALPAGPWAADPLPFDEPDRTRIVETLLGLYKRTPGEDAPGLLDAIAAATASGRCPPEAARDTWMTWDMVRELRDAGMQIGGHTHTHPVLARMSPERQAEEIDRCRERIAAELGEAPRHFSYPVGLPDSFTADTRRVLEARGVVLAFSLYGGHRRRGEGDRLDVPRTTVAASSSPAFLAAQATIPQMFARW